MRRRPIGPFHLFDVRPGKIVRTTRNAAEFGLPACVPEDLQGGDVAYNVDHLRAVLESATAAPIAMPSSCRPRSYLSYLARCRPAREAAHGGGCNRGRRRQAPAAKSGYLQASP